MINTGSESVGVVLGKRKIFRLVSLPRDHDSISIKAARCRKYEETQQLHLWVRNLASHRKSFITAFDDLIFAFHRLDITQKGRKNAY